MRLLEVYSMMESGQLSHVEAAEALNMSPKILKFRMTKFGHRLPLVLSTLDKIRHDEIGRPEAAEVLGVTVRQVNHLMNNWHVERPLKAYLVTRAASKVKWELRKKFAIDFIAGNINIEQAAEAAKCSTRQMRRWVSELLTKHYEMPFKDLKLVPDRRRSRLANEIEEAEGIELAKQRVLDAIADGKKAIQEEAFDRVLAKKRRKRPNV